MNVHDAHSETRLALGAYALGSLEPDEQRRVEAHLIGCPDCLAELDELESVVPVLATLAPGDLETPEPSPDLFARITTAVDDAEQHPPGRSRRWLVAVAAGVVVIAGAGTAVGLAADHHSQPVTTATASAHGVRLSVRATDAASGTRLVLTAKGLPARERCHLVAVADDGTRHDAGTWSASYEGHARVVESTDVPRTQLHRLELYGNGGTKLVNVDL
ncbi:zf-HC2 domain-containing protein [Jatrophihabitans endophyticus]|uniref:zf-HC2 domain-containing protein n=1 Tax=Jatrophihabitans endophyticus TaxID=1206085 RepID=UPI0019E4EF00|nr:zf-HC2 domain-containing protein [Jatrophihabitans endophyticus]MBE7186681.1 zf-HC2 domain-containing protein [Jatrophihabitans endophyticus]